MCCLWGPVLEKPWLKNLWDGTSVLCRTFCCKFVFYVAVQISFWISIWSWFANQINETRRYPLLTGGSVKWLWRDFVSLTKDSGGPKAQDYAPHVSTDQTAGVLLVSSAHLNLSSDTASYLGNRLPRTSSSCTTVTEPYTLSVPTRGASGTNPRCGRVPIWLWG